MESIKIQHLDNSVSEILLLSLIQQRHQCSITNTKTLIIKICNPHQ